MSTVTQYPDMPAAYPDALGINKTVGVSNVPTPLIVFRNNSTIPNLRAILQRFDFLPSNPSLDTAISIQLIPSVDVTGGAWVAVDGSQLEVNKTASSVSGSRAALTLFAQATAAHGNTPASGGLAETFAQSLGLEMPIGGSFAIFAMTDTATATADLLWSVNWLEKD